MPAVNSLMVNDREQCVSQGSRLAAGICASVYRTDDRGAFDQDKEPVGELPGVGDVRFLKASGQEVSVRLKMTAGEGSDRRVGDPFLGDGANHPAAAEVRSESVASTSPSLEPKFL